MGPGVLARARTAPLPMHGVAMTLITYLTRVHFADGVLEEALHGEMDLNCKRRPFVVAAAQDLTGTLGERFFAGLPARTVAEAYTDLPSRPTEQAAEDIAEKYRVSGCDVLIAIGGNLAIDLAKVARTAIAFDEPIAALSDEAGGGQRISGALPDLYSIPGTMGFASAISDYARVRLHSGRQVLLSSRKLIPTVTICDPTLTLDAGSDEIACALAGIVSRSVEVYLSPRYNPPADGLALDALARIPAIVDRLSGRGDIDAHRELMAAGLNSGLSMQKGLCVQHAIANALASASVASMNPVAVGPVLVPELVRFYGDNANGRCARVKASLGLPGDVNLTESLARFFADLPVATRLSQLRVCADDLATAADIAIEDRAINSGPRRLSTTDVLQILQAVH